MAVHDDPLAALSDDEIEALINNPAKIDTSALADALIVMLEQDVANIELQMEAMRIRSGTDGPTKKDEAWAKSASFAGAHMKAQIRRLRVRSAALSAPPPKRAESHQDRSLRIKAEHALGQARAEAVAAKVQNERLIRFMQEAQRVLPKDTYEAIFTASLYGKGALNQ
jgi:hypothetical protein